jgi:LPPG:FO 2-phospho-L-lactate transferase
VKVAVLSGGVGGARFLRGLIDVLPQADITVIGNVGDDLELLGLHVSPDLDTVLYTLSGAGDAERGWGRADESWRALDTVAQLGGDTWFLLGDRDIGLHLYRTEALRGGEPLSAVMARIAKGFGLDLALLPATDDPLRTWVDTPAGSFPFQQWFVARRHEDEVDGIRYLGAEEAQPAPGVLEAIAAADLLLVTPSNPYVSIEPILSVAAIRQAVAARQVPCVAVSPLIGGKAVKGPADRMLTRLAGGTTAAHVAGCYAGLIDALVLDEQDADDAPAVAALGVRPVVARTLMRDPATRRALAEAALGATGSVL